MNALYDLMELKRMLLDKEVIVGIKYKVGKFLHLR